MSYIEKSISIFGTELQFLQAFINAITAANSRITCTTADLETQFETPTNTPTFTLSVDEIYTITFTRDFDLKTSGNSYNITSPIFNSSIGVHFSTTYAYPNDKGTRIFKFAVIANDENIYLKLAGPDKNLNLPDIKFLFVKNNGISACGWATGSTSIMSSNFVSTGGQVYNKINRLPYTYNASDLTSIEVIKSKVFVENNTINRAFETSKIIDSTTVTADQIISIDSTKYYALDSNTLMEI